MGLDNGIQLIKMKPFEEFSKETLSSIEEITDFEYSGEIPRYIGVPGAVKIVERTYTCDIAKGLSRYDICYWRNCWNLRGKLLEVIYDKRNTSEGGKDNEKILLQESYIDLTPETLKRIREVLYKTLCDYEESPTVNRPLDEMAGFIAQDIINISWLIDYLEEDRFARVEFYDSY